MAATDLGICNLALGKIGARRIIEMQEESNEGRVCRLLYAETRDEVLRDHRWNFAIRRKSLVKLVAPPEFGWAFQYELPTDCLRLLEVNGWHQGRRKGVWEIEGKVVLTNDTEAKVRYVSRVENANRFDSVFVEALATKLASKIAMAINGSSSMTGELLTQYEKLTGPRARRLDAFESNPQRRPVWVDSDLVMSRHFNA